MIWLLLGLAALLVVAALVCVAAVIVGAQSEERRGGLLELDTWEARNALKHPPPGDDWFSSKLRRCNPAQRVHYHGVGGRCECGEKLSYGFCDETLGDDAA